jgi:hypothetical protein
MIGSPGESASKFVGHVPQTAKIAAITDDAKDRAALARAVAVGSIICTPVFLASSSSYKYGAGAGAPPVFAIREQRKLAVVISIRTTTASASARLSLSESAMVRAQDGPSFRDAGRQLNGPYMTICLPA